MKAEIITIGDEILIGQIIDTNSAWIGQQLNMVGFDVTRISSINDTPEAIVNGLNILYPDTNLVLLTGGLGPTKDDLTKHTLSKYFNMPLTFREEVYAHILELFSSLGRVPSPINREQAMLPDGCRVLPNKMGTAAGMLFEHNGRYIVSMPGVPYEMKHLMLTQVLPIVSKELLRQHIVHETILTVGVPESEISERIADIEENLPALVKLAYLPRPGMVRLRLTAKGQDEKQLQRDIYAAKLAITKRLGNVVYGANEESLEQVVGQMLAQKKQTISTAESCTGGYIAHKLTSIAGSSAYFLGSIVAYSNAVKIQQLGVEEEALNAHGAVSETVVKQMAEGAKKRLQTDWAISVSGIAGPDGGTDEKPVGTVWIALAGPEETVTQKFQFGNDRGRNIKKSAFAALDLLRTALLAH